VSRRVAGGRRAVGRIADEGGLRGPRTDASVDDDHPRRGGWNDAKEKAGLETAPSTGSRTKPKPDDVTLSDGMVWEELSVDQRWHYRNVEWNTERTLGRRARLRSWANDRKRKRGCQSCGETDPACLDFHHPDEESKEMAVTDLITYGHGRKRLREEMAKCDVLCANCHRKEQFEPPD